MLRQPVPLVSVGLRSKPRSIFPSAPLMRCLATACSRTAAALGSAVNQAAAGVRIAKTPLMVMSLLASSFAWSSEPTAANRVTFTSLDQVTRVAIATGGKVQYQAIGRLQNPDRLYYDLLGPKLLAHGNRIAAWYCDRTPAAERTCCPRQSCFRGVPNSQTEAGA